MKLEREAGLRVGAPNVLTVNAGSSSVKLGLLEAGDAPKPLFEGMIANIGQPTASLVTKDAAESDSVSKPVVAQDHIAAARILVGWLKPHISSVTIAAIGHRIVHGGPKYHEPYVINSQVLADLRELTPFDPLHVPIEIKLVEELGKLFPGVPQAACFDTAFHHDLPSVARLLPIPRRYEAKGIRRYGFHGLSYEFVMRELERQEGPKLARGRLILAHLGNGVSLTAVRGGASIDTTMGLTPAAGVPMSTRSGDLDPGLLAYLVHSEGYDADQFDRMVNTESGLLGLSETTGDMEKLLQTEAEDERAREAIDLFCYQVKKSIGGLVAALGGLDGLVFTGGMGEGAPKIRARICEGLESFGVEVASDRNQAGAAVISSESSGVIIRVIHTDEAATIARNVGQLIKEGTQV